MGGNSANILMGGHRMIERAKRVRMVVLDVDGTLTDGKLYIDNNGLESKAFNVKDGMSIAQGGKQGLLFAIITGKESKIVEKRAAELGITEIHQKISNKIEVLDKILMKYELGYDQVAYMGDDINDIPAMLKAGFNGVPYDACPDIVSLAHFKSTKNGGDGAVREFVEFIMRSQGSWEKVLEEYRNKR